MTPRFAYFDTSLLVPLYVRSKASPQAERTLVEFTENGELPVVLSELTRVEFVSVIARYVRTNQIDRVRAQEVIGVFEYLSMFKCYIDFTNGISLDWQN